MSDVGSAIADLAALRYQTYRSAAPGAAVVSLNVQIDINGGVLNPGEFRTLVWEPYNNPGQGAIVNNYIYNPGPRAVHYNLIAAEWGAQPYQNGRMTLVGNVLRAVYAIVLPRHRACLVRASLLPAGTCGSGRLGSCSESASRPTRGLS